MKTGYHGTFVVSWAQTEIDGLADAPLQALMSGACWSWRGEALRVDGPADVLRLERTAGETDLRRRVARRMKRVFGVDIGHDAPAMGDHSAQPITAVDNCFTVTDGYDRFTVTVIDTGPAKPPLLMFLNTMPPRGGDLWVVQTALKSARQQQRFAARDVGKGMICFTPGTTIATPSGPRRVEDLRSGDLVNTRDNGPRPIAWVGARRISGARLHVMPWLRPVRLTTGALGSGRPDSPLLVSPDHQLLVKGAAVQELFHTPEAMVTARDLINDHTIAVDHEVTAVTYVHLLLEAHQILWANGVETESFHPGEADLTQLSQADRRQLQLRFPELLQNPTAYGGYARRSLTLSEAAILRHAAA